MGVCDMCGREAALYKTSIEGTILNLCKECSRYGSVISEIRAATSMPNKSRRSMYTEEEPKEIIKIIVPDYWKRIKDKREQLNLKQEELAKKIAEKESVVHKLESGGLRPSIKLAEKLERLLGVTLIEEYEEEHVGAKEKKGENFTLGDFVKVRKR